MCNLCVYMLFTEQKDSQQEVQRPEETNIIDMVLENNHPEGNQS